MILDSEALESMVRFCFIGHRQHPQHPGRPDAVWPAGQFGFFGWQTLRQRLAALAEIIEAAITMMATKAFMVLLELLWLSVQKNQFMSCMESKETRTYKGWGWGSLENGSQVMSLFIPSSMKHIISNLFIYFRFNPYCSVPYVRDNIYEAYI